MNGRTLTYADSSVTHLIWTIDVGTGAPILPQVTLYFTTTTCTGTPYAATKDNVPPQLATAPRPFVDNPSAFDIIVRDFAAPGVVTIDAHSQLTSSCAVVTTLGMQAVQMAGAGQLASLPAAPITFR